MTATKRYNPSCPTFPVVLLVVLGFVREPLFSAPAEIDATQTIRDFQQLEYTRMQSVIDEGGTLNQTFVVGGLTAFRSEPKGTVLPYSVYVKKDHVFDEHALIHETDADPLAVVIRRTEALLNHLSMLPGAPDLSALRGEFEQKKQRASGMEGYYEICDIRRRIALSNPLLDFNDILFVEHDPAHSPYLHMTRQYYGFHHRNRNVGGLYLLKDAFGPNPEKIDVLAKAGNPLLEGVYLSPELSYDGRTIYFAWCAGTGDDEYAEDNCFHIYKVNVDGSGFRQLTRGPENDFDPCPLPGGRIAFISTRRSKTEFRMNLRCGALVEDAYTLHSMNPDGSDVITLSFHETHEWHPSVDNNGMIVYTRWDYVDRDSNEAHHMWRCFPDGRDARAPHGNYDLPWGDRGTPYDDPPIIDGKPNGGTAGRKGGSCLHPWGEWNIRAIPGSHKYIATAAGHHTVAFGSLVMIDTRIEDDGMMAQVRRVTPECLFPEAERGDYTSEEIKSLPNGWAGNMADYYANCMYGTAWPLSEDYYLCNFWKTILLLDRFGNKIVLYVLDDEAEDYRAGTRPIDPMPVTARPAPPALAEVNFDGEKANHPDHNKAVISIQNIYDTYPVPWPEGVVEQKQIKWLRVVQFIPKTTPGKNSPRVGGYSMATCRMSLGIVPVEDDGSVYCEAPVKVPIYFQALDENHMAIQSMKSLTYVHPGEKLSCVGCHEKSFHGWYAVPELKTTPLAFLRPPSKIQEEFPGHHTDPKKGAIPFNYHLLAKPALQRAGYGGEYKCYWAPGSGSRSIPGYVGAHASDIGGSLVDKYQSGAISEEDFHRIVMWIDLNSNELGWDHDVDAQKAGQVVWPEIVDVDPNNPIPVESGLPNPDDPWQKTALRPGRGLDKPKAVDHLSTPADEIRITAQDGICRVSHPGNDPFTISLYDCRGSMAVPIVSNRKPGRGSIDLSNLPRGMYVLNVKTEKGVARSRMISWSR